MENECENCNEWLELKFDPYVEFRKGYTIHLENVPLYYCKNCKLYKFPSTTNSLIDSNIEDLTEVESKEGKILKISANPSFKKQYNFCEIDFIYDYRDYEYIPGLLRPWDDGFLCPVFFDIKVLGKYTNDRSYQTSLGSKTYGSIQHEDFLISFGINQSKRLIFWLGDIDKLPLNEQYYLRSFNIESDHDLKSDFYNAQIKVTSPDSSLENKILKDRDLIDKWFEKKYSIKLNHLSGEISEIIGGLDYPIYWTEKELISNINSWNQILIESINVKGIKEVISQLDSKIDLKSLKSLKSLEILIQLLFPKIDWKNLLLPFYVLYDFRIILSHLQSIETIKEVLIEINRRLNLPDENKDNEKIYQEIFNKLFDSFQILKQNIF